MSTGQRFQVGRTMVVLAMQQGLGVLGSVPRDCDSRDNAELAQTVTQILGWGSATMVRKQGVVSDDGKQQWTRFVDLPLTGWSKSDVAERYSSWDDFASDLAGLLAGGYRVAVSYNEGNNSFIASVTCRAVGDPNQGSTFTAFAGDWVTALQVAAFKHYVVAKGVWSSIAGDNSPDAVG